MESRKWALTNEWNYFELSYSIIFRFQDKLDCESSMSEKNTLISLAMLKVNIDHGKDYLEYLRPYVLHVLIERRPERITDDIIRDLINSDFGLVIPSQVVQIILKRISRVGIIQKQEGAYFLSGDLPSSSILEKKAHATRHIDAIALELIDFSKQTGSPLRDINEAVIAICHFLKEFSIPCLKAYLRGTAIPQIGNKDNAYQVLVGQFLLRIQGASPQLFESFVVLLKGHMLANALLCPDLQNAPRSFKKTKFYFDTPILIRLLGLEGKHRREAVRELLSLLNHLEGKAAIFSHTMEELQTVVRRSSDFIDSKDGRGAIVSWARREEKTKSDLLLIAEKIEDVLEENKIEIISTPPHIAKFNIDHAEFEQVLEDEVSYYNEYAKEYDIKSVRCIYVVRKNNEPKRIEDANAIFVTSNSAFSRAAYDYGLRHDERHAVSSVITDFSLINVAWLKAPMGAPSLPVKELIAYAYGALEPKNGFWAKCLNEIDKMEKEGSISIRDHQLLRSSVQVQDELMRLTLGNEDSLSNEVFQEALSRVTSEIKSEEVAKHQVTKSILQDILEKNRKLQEHIYWGCVRKSNIWSYVFVAVLSVLLFCGAGYGILGIIFNWPYSLWLLIPSSLTLFIMTLSNLFFGATVKQLYFTFKDKLLFSCLRGKEKEIGLKLVDD